jgi:NADPH-dependent F420 reductase
VNTSSDKPVIAVLGGTGREGSGLAFRLSAAGYIVVIGSRDAVKAKQVAAELNAELSTTNISGTSYAAAANAATVIILAVPYAAQQDIAHSVASALRGKTLIDATVPLTPPRVDLVRIPEGGSAVAQLQHMLGPDVSVVAAFQNISAHHLRKLDHAIDSDVLICGDNREACDLAIDLARAIGLRGIYAGPIGNAVAVEALTSILVAINRRYKVPASGLRITGLGESAG